LTITVEALLFLGLWLLLVGELAPGEVLVGTGAAMLSAAAFRPNPRWLLQAWRIPFHFFTETLAILAALAQWWSCVGVR